MIMHGFLVEVSNSPVAAGTRQMLTGPLLCLCLLNCSSLARCPMSSFWSSGIGQRPQTPVQTHKRFSDPGFSFWNFGVFNMHGCILSQPLFELCTPSICSWETSEKVWHQWRLSQHLGSNEHYVWCVT